TCPDGAPREFEVLISMFGLGPDTTANDIAGHEVEMIGFDRSAGVYNYYSVEDLSGAGSGERKQVWRFFGNSQDFLSKGPGDGNFPLQVRRCAGCHVNGGLIQKELQSPWLHWDQGGFVSGEAGRFIKKSPDALGNESQGVNVEGFVEPGNTEYA